MTTFKVRTVDGAILGPTTATTLPDTAKGVELHSASDPAVTMDTHWWTGSAFAARVDAPSTIPNDASFLVDSAGPYRIATAPAGYENRAIRFVGKYKGDRAAPKSKDELLVQVDAAAAAARLKYLTIVGGQSDAYREKMADVASLNTLGGTTALILTALTATPAATQKAKWPFLYAEMQAAGFANLIAARDAITNAAAASRAARADIERIRRKAKIDIRAATTVQAANTVAAGIVWPT
jgi:hypothetical protein